MSTEVKFFENSVSPYERRQIAERCLVGGTHVCMPFGPVAIEKLCVGDEVIGFENGVSAAITITEILDNSVQNDGGTPLIRS